MHLAGTFMQRLTAHIYLDYEIIISIIIITIIIVFLNQKIILK